VLTSTVAANQLQPVTGAIAQPAWWEIAMTASREEAAKQCVAVFDTAFFKALCEPARIAVLRELILLGRADIAAIANRLPQDRSVIARHLQHLAAAKIVSAEKVGRHVFYEVDARGVAERLESILEITRLLEAAITAGREISAQHPGSSTVR
jgi:DNA-binding transcriptional ArsR family regulator